MMDTFNLGWKLAAVLEDRSEPRLLETYDAERRPVAQELIDFDKEWSALLATPPVDPRHPERGGVDRSEVSEYYTRQGRYTAGVATRYPPSILTGHAAYQDLATGYPLGMRFHSAPVVRVCDGKRVELGHAAQADGRWRLYAFSDAAETRLRNLCGWLTDADESPIRRFNPAGADIDSLIDVRGILQREHADIEFAELPAILRPATGRLGLIDYEKATTVDHKTGPDIFELRGINREAGCMVIVRPDQYVAHVLPLDAYDALAGYFGGVFAVRPAAVGA